MDRIIIIGGGVAGINAATELVDSNYKGEIVIIDKGKDPFNRQPEEVMTGMLGAGGWSDGKLTYHTAIGGQLAKYCGERKAMQLMDKVIANFRRFHPYPEQIMKSDPQAEPEFIKPYFNLRLFPVYHIGTDYLHEIAVAWYTYLVDNGVKFHWRSEVLDIDFEEQCVTFHKGGMALNNLFYDDLIFGVGKSGIDFSQNLMKKYNIKTEPKSVQIGVRFEAPQKYFQKLIDVSYDFKLYQKFEDEGVSLRTFCTNNNAAYVAAEYTYGDISYNGHAKKDPKYINNLTNFGILMEIRGIDDPFSWSREKVKQLQLKGKGLYYSPLQRKPSTTSEGKEMECEKIYTIQPLKEALGKYATYIINFIKDMRKVFPEMGLDWGIYIPEVKYLSPEPLVNYKNLSLKDYKNIHFVGDALSARGITVSGAQGIYVSESIIKPKKMAKTKLEETKKLRKPDGTVVYYLNNQLHNHDGPAVIHPDGKKEYYLFGIEYTPEKFNAILQDREGLPWYKNPSMQAKLGTSRF